MNTRDNRQQLIGAWTRNVFGVAMMTPHERVLRVLEEALELAQAEGLTREEATRLTDYVFARPVGNPEQELGGLGLTLVAYAESKGLSADDAEEREIHRVLSRDPAYFRKRNLEKAAAGVGDYRGEDT